MFTNNYIDTSVKRSLVDTTSTSIAYLSNADIHNNGAVVVFDSDDLGNDWARAANSFEYAGDADEITIMVNIFASDVGASNYWSRPSLRIADGDGSVIAQMDDLAMQQNGVYSGNVQITGNVTIKNPTSKIFVFTWFDTENRTATLSPIPSSHVSLKATKSIEVYAV